MTYNWNPKSDNIAILDIGCGTTPKDDADVLMDIDNSLEALFPDRKFIKHDANILPLPFSTSAFDKIYISHLIEHLEVEDELLFKEIYRILKVYGRVIIECPNSLFIYHRLLYLIGIIPCDFILCHRKHYSFQQLKHNLRNAGFRIFELDNKWLFNPLRNFTNMHIKIIAKKLDYRNPTAENRKPNHSAVGCRKSGVGI